MAHPPHNAWEAAVGWTTKRAIKAWPCGTTKNLELFPISKQRTLTSPLSSACTTPGLNLIDPRLLEPGVPGEDGMTLANKVSNTPDDRPSPWNDHEDGATSSPSYLRATRSYMPIYRGLMAVASKMEYPEVMLQQLDVHGDHSPALHLCIPRHHRRPRLEAERCLHTLRSLKILGTFQKVTLC